MKISSSLLKPSIFDLERQYRALEQEVRSEGSEPLTELGHYIDRSVGDLEVLKLAVSSLDDSKGVRIPEDLYEKFRHLKLELRFALRKWKRFSDAKLRSKKSEGESHVPTLVA